MPKAAPVWRKNNGEGGGKRGIGKVQGCSAMLGTSLGIFKKCKNVQRGEGQGERQRQEARWERKSPREVRSLTH